jgi:phosphoserine phosphatase
MSKIQTQSAASNRLGQGFLPEEATRKDTYAYMDHLIDNLLLQLSENHTVINQDGTEEEKAKGVGAGE